MEEGGMSADIPLDYASFQIWPSHNRYEAFACYNNQREKLFSGDLEHLVLHLPQLKDIQHENSDDHFKLQLPENLRRSAWFNKSTLLRFLHIICFSKLFAIGDEISQLEEARKFHLSLYAQGHRDGHRNDETDGHNLQMTSAEATKNELLRALNLRLGALSTELIAAFGQATNGTFSYKQILDLIAFCQHFGAVNLRNSLSRYLELSQMHQDVDPQTGGVNFSQDPGKDNGKAKDGTAQPLSPVVNPIIYGASPAKAAQVERRSSTESESSNSDAEDQPYIDRSRSMIRSASPRRSASPMRRVQIGKSGSRRAPALTIKSLSYIPAKERIFPTRDAGGNSSDEESAQPLKKPESNATSMSVRDAISLFERKQKDQITDVQKKKLQADASVTTVNTTKSVLRRWSSGMGDPPNQQSANASESFSDTSSKNLHDGVNQDTYFPDSHSNQGAEIASVAKTSDEDASVTAGQVNNLSENQTDNGSTGEIESNKKVTASADWNRQKEDELNLMMMKMMETKPTRNRTMGSGVSRSQELPSGQRGGFYDHYKQKREEKLRGENSGKRAEKDEKFKSLQGMLDQRKVEMSSKSVGVAGKQDSLVKPRKAQKNPSPSSSSTLQSKKDPSKSASPLRQPKKESPKPAAPKKISSKASPVPASRKSWPSAPSPKTSDITPNRTPPNWVSSTGIAAPRRKSQPTPSPIRSSPKVERTPTQPKPKNTKTTHTDTNPTLKNQEVKKQRSVTKTVNKTEVKALQTSQDSSPAVSAKPSFYNKVTRKGSVVPLESKPFLRKRTGAGPGVAPVKSKVSQSDEPLNTENIVHAEEVFEEMPKPISPKKEENQISPTAELPVVPQEAPVTEENNVVSVSENQEIFEPLEEEEILPEIDSDISPTAWVEIEEQKEDPPHHTPPLISSEPPVLVTSPRVRHSLSQMLQEDSGEPEIIEWGNAENPPAIVYQKDVAKGLKRLLKFARKSKGDGNATGWSSPSVFSDGEDEPEETKAASKRNADALLRKASMQAKGFGQLRTSLGSSYDGGNSSRSSDFPSLRELHTGQSNMSKFGTQASDASGSASTKSTRSFFSLSTFRSSKSNETRLR